MACPAVSNLENRIDELHDDILVHILSFLSLKEAGQTSVLSKRWRDLWAYVPNLNFDNGNFLHENYDLAENLLAIEEEEPKYCRWVDKVMSSHKAPSIDEFRVQFNIHCSHKDNIDNWVRSAVEKRVKRFQLDIQPVTARMTWGTGDLEYILPSVSFNSLTSLQLSWVEVTGEFLEKLLHDCPLEYLSVCNSFHLKNLKVVGPSLKLKTLRLMDCYWPKHALEISAPNLTSFDYDGRALDSPFKSIPKLTEFFIGGDHGTHVLHDFSSLSSYTSQIEVLTLEAEYDRSKKHMRIAEAFPICTRLKMLHITIYPYFDHHLFGLLSLIKACPLLQKFVVTFRAVLWKVERTAETIDVAACPHPSLKIVEIMEFVGWELDFGFAEYLIENAVSLEKIIIQPTDYDTSDEPCIEERRRRAIQRAEQLRASLKPGIELQIRDDPLTIKYLSY